MTRPIKLSAPEIARRAGFDLELAAPIDHEVEPCAS